MATKAKTNTKSKKTLKNAKVLGIKYIIIGVLLIAITGIAVVYYSQAATDIRTSYYNSSNVSHFSGEAVKDSTITPKYAWRTSVNKLNSWAWVQKFTKTDSLGNREGSVGACVLLKSNQPFGVDGQVQLLLITQQKTASGTRYAKTIFDKTYDMSSTTYKVPCFEGRIAKNHSDTKLYVIPKKGSVDIGAITEGFTD